MEQQYFDGVNEIYKRDMIRNVHKLISEKLTPLQHLKLISELYRPNIALIPVGGSPNLTGGWAHLPPREASLCAHWVSPEVAIPVHFDPKSTDGDQFAEKVRGLSPTIKVVILKPGESYTFNPNK